VPTTLAPSSAAPPRFRHAITVAACSLLAAASTYAATCYFAALWPADSLPLMSRLYEEQATLRDLVPTSGDRNHLLSAQIPERVRPAETYVAWVAPLSANGAPDYSRVFPYVIFVAGEAREFTVNAGGKGSGDLNTYYRAEVCRVRAAAMTRVNDYFTALTHGGPTETRKRAAGISLTNYASSIDCEPNASIVIRRSQ